MLLLVCTVWLTKLKRRVLWSVLSSYCRTSLYKYLLEAFYWYVWNSPYCTHTLPIAIVCTVCPMCKFWRSTSTSIYCSKQFRGAKNSTPLLPGTSIVFIWHHLNRSTSICTGTGTGSIYHKHHPKIMDRWWFAVCTIIMTFHFYMYPKMRYIRVIWYQTNNL